MNDEDKFEKTPSEFFPFLQSYDSNRSNPFASNHINFHSVSH